MTEGIDGFDGAARNLISGYAHNLDYRKLDALVALFSADGVVVTSGNEKKGHDGIRDWYADVFSKNPPGLHLIANTILTRDGPEAGSSTSDELFFRKNADGVWTPQARFVYLDWFVLEGGVWLISRHEMVRVD